jgi:hypothetical protein
MKLNFVKGITNPVPHFFQRCGSFCCGLVEFFSLLLTKSSYAKMSGMTPPVKAPGSDGVHPSFVFLWKLGPELYLTDHRHLINKYSSFVFLFGRWHEQFLFRHTMSWRPETSVNLRLREVEAYNFMFMSLRLSHNNYCHKLVTIHGSMNWMIGFISHVYNLFLHFTKPYMTHYVFCSPSSSTAALRDSHNSILSQSQIYFTSGGLPPISSSWRQAPWDSPPVFFSSQLNTCLYSPYVTSSQTRGWVYSLQLLLTLASAVILRPESRGTHDHILLSQIRDSPNMEGQVPISVPPRNKVAPL